MENDQELMGLYLGIFLVTLSGLMFEIALTRIFSATIWYHFAFVAISVALLGWGLGGFALHLLRRRVAFSLDRAALATFLYGVSLPLALWLVVRLPFHPDRLAWYFAFSLGPFFLAGIALSMLFALGRENAGRLYFADLLGASLGALAVTFLLGLGGENAVLAVSIAPFVAAALFSPRLRASSAVAVVLVLAAIGLNERTRVFSIRSAPTKGLYRHVDATPGARIALTGWNAYSRIDAVTGFASPFLARLYIDSDAWTNVLEWDGDVASLAHMKGEYRARPFELVPPAPRTLVIGPGGGSDVLFALAAGSEKVTAVEMNPLMLRFVRHFGAQAGGIYDHPRVEAVLSEGRTFVRRTDRRFDVVLMGFVDSWAAVASGGLSLSENHLYTVEAFADYLDHLTPDGQLVIMRWPVDAPRLVSNAVALLGASEAGRRVAVLLEERKGDREDPPQMVFMLKKRPWTEQETERMVSWAGVQPVIVPGRHVDEPYAALFSGRTSFSKYVAEARSRIEPVFDDRPFFFARAKPWGLPQAMRRAFVGILAFVLAVCALFLALGKPKGERAGPYAGSVAFFASLGVGFIALELALLQHLTLLLGHPIFTLSILLFTLLAAGGVGSRFAGRFPLGTVCLGVAALAAAYAAALPRVVPLLLPLPLGARIAVAVLLVAPLGFLMGMPFPSGLRATGQGPFPPPPFYWGLNGIFSVIGSLCTIGVAVLFGFTWAMLGGAAFYVLAALASRAFGAAASAVESAA
jgi:predicted membrane-bound spermidine synthase